MCGAPEVGEQRVGDGGDEGIDRGVLCQRDDGRIGCVEVSGGESVGERKRGWLRRPLEVVDVLRGRRLAHQVSLVILRDVAARIGAPIDDLRAPSVAVRQSVPALGALLESELAALG